MGIDAWNFGIQNILNTAAACQQAFQGGTNGNGPGSTWAIGAMGYTMFNPVIGPNGGGKVTWSACRVGCCAQAQHAHFVNAASYHSGGVNVLFGDGSVHFIKNTIALNTWWSLATRDGGETISSNSYN